MPASSSPSKDRSAKLKAARERIAKLESQVAELESASLESRDREARFRILSELVTDCCWVRWRSADGAEERRWINEAFTELTGFSAEEFEAGGRASLIHPGDLEKVQEFVDGPPGVSEHEFRIVRKDGEVRWLHERMLVREEGGGMTVYGATRDVTDEKSAQKVLRDHHQQLERRVAERTKELVVVNQQLEREVAERRQIAAELRQAKEAAEASSLAKSRFLATMTHELRTPLHAIVGLSDLLLEADLPAAVEPWVRTLQTSAKALHHLVQEVLDLSKIEAEQLIVEEHPFVLRELLGGLEDLVEEGLKARGNRLTCEVDAALPESLVGDSARLRQVLLNLLDNAVKFTHGGSIELTVRCLRRRDDTYRVGFGVRDTGIGFDAATSKHLFDPFTQADASTTRQYGGTGLGLAISYRLVQLLGGELEAESVPGEGSSFSFSIDLRSTGEESARREPPKLVRGAGRRVLVAEDNPVNQLVVSEQLEALGFEVHVVADGALALEALAKRDYDAWLLDCHMPVMDGFEAIRQWRSRESGKRVPVIAVTASAVRAELDACLTAGMDDLLTKPFRQQDLARALARWLHESDD